MHEEGSHWVITHHDSGVTTQGRTRLRAILMLADALAAYEDSDEDLLHAAEDIFTLDEDDREFLDKLEDN